MTWASAKSSMGSVLSVCSTSIGPRRRQRRRPQRLNIVPRPPLNAGRRYLHAAERLEPHGGAMPLNSRFYIERPADAEFMRMARQDSIVLVKGARQVGKTSLLGSWPPAGTRDGPGWCSPTSRS